MSGIAPIRRHETMKTKNLFLLPAVIAALNSLPAGRVAAQTFTTLYSFTALSRRDSDYYYYNSDGGDPQAGLILSGHTLYGTASAGGSGGAGTVFAMNTDGTGFTNLHVFAQPHYFAGYVPDTNPDGIYPNALVVSGSTLYGAAGAGGYFGRGTLFAVNTDGTGFTNLHQFTAGSRYLESSLLLSGSTLYGAAAGTVFAINRNGTGFTNLHHFTALNYYTNSDGDGPNGLILSGNTLYGTASYGGSSGNGTVFAVNTNGTGFRVLHTFSGGSNGANPSAGFILSGNILYGLANYGGNSGVFAVNINGTGFTNLHSFTTLSGGYYGTNSDGAFLYAGLILSGSTFYGTAAGGGTFGSGTVFSLSFAPQLTIARSGTKVILSWPVNVAGFDYTGYRLQSTTDAVSPGVWSTNSPAPVVIAGRNTVTNPITGGQQFYRLVQ